MNNLGKINNAFIRERLLSNFLYKRSFVNV
jgi:hypothetical protein